MPGLQRALDVEAIPSLVQPPAPAPNHRLEAGDARQRILNLRQSICSARRRHNARLAQRSIRIQSLEHLHRPSEEIYYLVPGRVCIAIAGRSKGVDARSVLVELVLPEMLECAGVGQPVFLHCLEESGSTCAEEAGDGVRLRRGAAIGWVAAVAEVWPVGLYCVSLCIYLSESTFCLLLHALHDAAEG